MAKKPIFRPEPPEEPPATPAPPPPDQAQNPGREIKEGGLVEESPQAATDQAIDQRLTRAPNTVLAQQAKRDDTMAVAFQGLVPSSIGEAMQLSAHLAKSGAIPSTLRGNPETVFTVIIAGMELGLTPIRAIQQITNIKGKLCIAADLQLAVARRSGTLEFFDEGFEISQKTDLNLERRTQDASRILALVETMTPQKPYGWCTIKRKGDSQLYTRVFTWDDAERVNIKERDDDSDSGDGAGRGQASVKKLSEKSNYKNYPQDMYPKRARARTLQLSHSDALAGMPAIEAMDGFIEGEIVQVEPTSTEDTIDRLLLAVRGLDTVAYTSIVAGFESLQLGMAKRLQLLTQFKGNSAGLLEWLKDEYANRANRGLGRARKDTLADETKQPQVATNVAPAETKSADPAPKQVAPAPPAAAVAPVASSASERLKNAAASFREKSTSF